MIAQEATRPCSLLTAISRDEFMELEVPPIEYLVDGLLVSGSATLFSAREKAGKGLIMIDLAYCIATGTPFLDRAVMEGPVIYIALEENAATLQGRLKARDKGRGGYPLYIVRADGSVEGQEFRLDTEIGIQALLELIQDIQPVLVLIDPLREAHGGRENESDDMAPRLRALRSVSHQTNTAIVVSHHAGKMSGTFRGSTAIRASFDDELQFTREDTDNDADVRGVLRAEGRNLQKVVEHIAFNGPDHRWVVTNVPPTMQMPNLRQKILDSLNETDEWLDAAAIANVIPGVKLGSVQNQLSRMLQETPRPFAVDNEKPRKGNPRKYHCLQGSVIPHHSSYNDDLTNEETGGRPANVREFRSVASNEEVF
ncbi:MAG TPA: AAA family ATPase [Thermomicrobiales bacterium]|nr:AAA family ATPase [Thermomicrobiales bacterium]